MPGTPTVIVLGGGLSGVAAAHALAHAGYDNVTIIERAAALGGLAGSFQREGRFYPLGYHHILHRDRTLLFFLDRIGVLPAVRWRKIRMLFRVDGRLHDLASPAGFLRFPMPFIDKLRFVRLMLRAFRKRDWSDWQDRSAVDLLDAWAGPNVRHRLFEPLTRLKFELPCEQVSGAWLGARLHFREGSAPLGYVPGANWTRLLCDGLTRLLRDQGVRVLLNAAVTALHARDGRLREAELADGTRIGADLLISSIPTEVYCRLRPDDATSNLASIRYTALISAVCATRQSLSPDFYWLNLPTLDRAACGVFRLDSLNPTIGAPGEACVNFVTHLQRADRPMFRRTDAELLAAYAADFHEIFGAPFEPFWSHVTRVPMYSPIFYRGYRNPPVRSATFENLYFAGNYRTFPSIASTGTALASGLDAAAAILGDRERPAPLSAAAAAFRLRHMPRA